MPNGSTVQLRLTSNGKYSLNQNTGSAAKALADASPLEPLAWRVLLPTGGAISSEGASGGVVYYRANTTDANNLIYRTVSGDSSYTDFAGNGVKPDEDKKDQQIIFVVPNGTTQFIAEFHKNSAFTSEY